MAQGDGRSGPSADEERINSMASDVKKKPFRFRELSADECERLCVLFVRIERCAYSGGIAADCEKPWRAEGDVEEIEEALVEIRKYGREE